MKTFKIGYLDEKTNEYSKKWFYSESANQAKKQFNKLFPQWVVIYVMEEVEPHDPR